MYKRTNSKPEAQLKVTPCNAMSIIGVAVVVGRQYEMAIAVTKWFSLDGSRDIQLKAACFSDMRE